MEDCVEEFVLGGNDGDDIITVLIFFVLGDSLALSDIEVTSDFGEENCKSDHNNTPGVVDNIPDVGDGFLDPDKFGAELNGDTFKNSFEVLVVTVDCPVGFRARFLLLLFLLIFLDDSLRVINVVRSGREKLPEIVEGLLKLVLFQVVLDHFSLQVSHAQPEPTIYQSHTYFSLKLHSIISQRY